MKPFKCKNCGTQDIKLFKYGKSICNDCFLALRRNNYTSIKEKDEIKIKSNSIINPDWLNVVINIGDKKIYTSNIQEGDIDLLIKNGYNFILK